MKIKNPSLLKLVTGFIALFVCANVNAAFIESRTLEGDNGGTYTYQLYTDRLEFSLGFSDVFDMTSAFFPFSSFEEASMLDYVISNIPCNVTGRGGISCHSNQAYDSISGTFSFLPEFRSLFQFTGYNVDRNTIVTLSTIDGNRETFYTGTPIISPITQGSNPVSAPASIGLFALVSLMLFKRRNKHL